MLFGTVKTTYLELTKLLLSDVRPKAERLIGPRCGENKAYTQAVNKVLYDKGTQNEYEVCCKHIPGTCEWLLDVVWWSDGSRGECGIALAAESEWSPDLRELRRL